MSTGYIRSMVQGEKTNGQEIKSSPNNGGVGGHARPGGGIEKSKDSSEEGSE